MGLGAEMGWGVGVYGEGDGFGPLGMEMVWGLSCSGVGTRVWGKDMGLESEMGWETGVGLG